MQTLPRLPKNGRSVLAACACVLVISGCGGGSGSTLPPPPPITPDFSLTVSPTSGSVAQGGALMLQVTVSALDGFNSSGKVTISGAPAGVTISPAQFSFTGGIGQPVAVSADASAPATSATLTFSATSGSLSHSLQVPLKVTTATIKGNVSLRNQYIRTDALWDISYLNYAQQRWIFCDSFLQRCFASNATQSRVDVFDMKAQSLIAQITVPNPWVGDISPDHKTIYMGTQLGDLYEIDGVALKVTKRLVSSQIGPRGFEAYGACALSNGKIALLGAASGRNIGGLPAIDGFQDLLIWNPADNSAQDYGLDDHGSMYGHISSFTLNADRSKVILVANSASNTGISVFDPATGTEKTTLAVGTGEFPVIVTPDGVSLLVPYGPGVAVYGTNTLQQTDQFTIGDGQEGYGFVLSPDGNTLYAVSRITFNTYAIDWKNHKILGSFGNFSVSDVVSGITAMAVDSTGLIIGVVGHGVGFLDASVLLPAPPKSIMNICCYPLIPSYGPVAGGTQVKETGVQPTAVLTNVYFGLQPGTAVYNDGAYWNATSPAGSPGVVNVTVDADDGSFLMLPDGYSYGPTIVALTTNATTEDGAPTGRVYGYGFGVPAGSSDPSLAISVGSQNVTNFTYAGYGYSPAPGLYPTPLEMIQFTIPPGTAGTSADLAVSDSAGQVTKSAAITYYPKLKNFPLPGASLAQGIYDANKDVYYFTDKTSIRVFSRTQGTWLSSVNLPNSGRLWSLSLSPDGSKLAVSDSGSNLIFLLSTNPLAVAGSFPVNSDPTSRAGALSITNAGIVYFIGSGINALHKLNTSSGTVTDVGTLMLWSPYSRMLSGADDRHIYFNLAGSPFILDSFNDTTAVNDAIGNQGDLELAVSGDQTTLTAADYVMDTNLNPQSFISLNEKQTWNETAAYGEKLNANGTLLFRPLKDGLDVIDARTGVLLTRIALPITLAPIYDALVADGHDNILVMITGAQNDGISILDLQSLPAAPALSYAAHSATPNANVAGLQEQNAARPNLSHRPGVSIATRRPRIPYAATPASTRPLIPQ